MSAARSPQAARAAGIQLGIDGDDLVLEASAPPPAAMLDLLSRHKAEVLAVLAATARENKLSPRRRCPREASNQQKVSPDTSIHAPRGAAGCKN